MKTYLNAIPKALIYAKTATNGHKFSTINLPIGQKLGLKAQWVTITVNGGQVFGKNDAYKNIALGESEATRMVSYPTQCKKNGAPRKGTSYSNLTVTNADIAEVYKAVRADYEASQATAEAPAEG